MAATWRTVRVFISSTFKDMQSERDHLVRFVFPELRERCEKRRLHLVDIDLRWGVTEDESRQGRVLEICLDEVERCRPFFVGLLGERYGWTPPAYDVPDEPRYDWVRTETPGHSLTAMEIIHGVLRNPEMRARAFFYFRDPAFLEDLPGAARETFAAESPRAAAKLGALKDSIRGRFPVFENYPCAYGGLNESGEVRLAGLEEFGRRVLEDLWSAIQAEFPASDEKGPDAAAVERAYHEAFIEDRSLRFLGRADLLARLWSFVAEGDGGLLVVTGKAGFGKSTLLANFAREAAKTPANAFVLAHFIGVSPGSTDIRLTLGRLCRELAARFGIADLVPEDYQGLRGAFPQFLERAGAQGRTLIVLDGLNQLDDRHGALRLDWLPLALPPGVKIVASTLEGPSLDALRRRRPAPPELVVGPIDPESRRDLVRSTLREFRKTLDERPGSDQMGLLLAKPAAESPLYLAVACEEMRVFGDFARVTDLIAGFPDDVAGLFEGVVARLERDHGPELVRTTLTLLECARHGLLEDEILEILGRERGAPLPRAQWSGLFRGLRFYLRPPGESGESAIDFFHRELSKAVRRRYLGDEAARAAGHGALVRFFRSKADPRGDGAWTTGYPRALAELPRQCLEAGMRPDLYRLARDPAFLAAQAAALPDDPQVPFETIQTALEAALRADDAAAAAEFLLAHARRLAGGSVESPLDALRSGSLERAWELAGLQDGERRLLWQLLMAWELGEGGRTGEARATLERALSQPLPRLSSRQWLGGAAVFLLTRTFPIDEKAADLIQKGIFEDGQRRELCRGLAARGLVQAALAVAFSLDEGSIFDEVDSAIIAAAARSGEIELALRLAEISLHERDEGFAIVGKALVKEGRVEEGLKAARRIVDPAERGKALAGIASALTGAGQHEAMAKVFAEALACLEGLEDKDVRARHMAEVAAAQAAAGEFEAADRTVSAVPLSSEKTGAMLKIAEAKGRDGLAFQARIGFLETVDLVAGPGFPASRDYALAGLAAAQARCGFFEDACETAAKIDNWDQGMEALSRVAAGTALAGSVKTAESLFGRITEMAEKASNPQMKARALQEIAKARAEAGMLEAAIETARRVGSIFTLPSLLSEAAKAARGIVDDETADRVFSLISRTAGSFSSPYDACQVLAHVARSRAERGDFEEAVAAVRSMPLERERATATVMIAPSLADGGRSFEARDLLASLLRGPDEEESEKRQGGAGHDGAEDLGKALADAARVLAGRGEFSLARETASAAGHLPSRSEAFRDTAVLMAGLGQTEDGGAAWAEALKAAGAIEDAAVRRRALIRAAGAMGRSGLAAEARRILADVIRDLAGPPTEDPPDLAVSLALGEVVREQAAMGDLAEALETADRIEEIWVRVEALCDAALAMAKSGRNAEARQVLDRASEVPFEGDDYHLYVLALGKVYEAWAELGDEEKERAAWTNAQAWARRAGGSDPLLMGNPYWSPGRFAQDLLKEKAVRLIEKGELDKALDTARLLMDGDSGYKKPGGYARAEIFRKIAGAFAGRGLFEEARRIADEMLQSDEVERDDKIGALVEIARSQDRAALKTRARETLEAARRVTDVTQSFAMAHEKAEHRAKNIAVVAAAQVRAGWREEGLESFDQALRAAESIDFSNAKMNAFRGIALELGRALLYDEAEAAAARMDRDSEYTLGEIARHASANGFGEAAVRIAEAHLGSKADLVLELAGALIEAGDARSFKRIVPLCVREPDQARKAALLLIKAFPEQAADVAGAIES